VLKKALLRGQGEGVEAIDARLDELGRKMDRLRSLYESFFMGSDRVPPNAPRRELNRLMLEMQQTPISNPTLRFRFQTLQQRWVLFTTYWNRTMQEIEAGTYRRDLQRAHRHLAARGGSISEQEALALGIPASRVKAFVGRQSKLAESRKPATEPSAPLPTPPPASPEPKAIPSPRLSEEQLQSFYRRYAEAHQKTGTPLRATAEQLRDRLEKLLAGQTFAKFELDVAVEGGKVKVRARPVR
jgi:hypothetical protein